MVGDLGDTVARFGIFMPIVKKLTKGGQINPVRREVASKHVETSFGRVLGSLREPEDHRLHLSMKGGA
jgi:hypothetical protein